MNDELTYLDEEERGAPPFEPTNEIVRMCPFERTKQTFQVYESSPSPGVTITQEVCTSCGETLVA